MPPFRRFVMINCRHIMPVTRMMSAPAVVAAPVTDARTSSERVGRGNAACRSIPSRMEQRVAAAGAARLRRAPLAEPRPPARLERRRLPRQPAASERGRQSPAPPPPTRRAGTPPRRRHGAAAACAPGAAFDRQRITEPQENIQTERHGNAPRKASAGGRQARPEVFRRLFWRQQPPPSFQQAAKQRLRAGYRTYRMRRYSPC